MIEETSLDNRPAPHTFVLFGASGDLAKRKLLPAFYSLYRDGRLPENFLIVGVSRRRLDNAEFQSQVRKSIETYSRHNINEDHEWDKFVAKFHYCALDVNETAHFAELRQMVETLEKQNNITPNRIFYLAMAPEYFGITAVSLKTCGLTETSGWKRLVIEKPFGRSLESAQVLNNQLSQVFKEDEIYRIDHYLGKEMVQNIEVIRFANSIFEPVWNNRSIANVQITSSETVGVEERAGYYEGAGALRDMVQNHMLQMVMMIAMEPPSRLKTEAIRDEKVKVLRSLRRYTGPEVAQNVLRGQYTSGTVKNQTVPGYREEHNVAPNSKTGTYIAARLFVDNFRWAGVPFYIRTGKRMPVKSTEIVIQFNDMPKRLYFNDNGNLGPDLLGIRVHPYEGMYIQMNAKRPGSSGSVIPLAMEFSQQPDQSPEAYERLLHDAMQGDSTFFTRWDEVSLAWKFVDPIADAFANDPLVAPHDYKAGSWGPEAADKLLAQDGFKWWPIHGQDTASVDESLEHKYARVLGAK